MKEDVLEKVRAYVVAERMICAGDRVLLALSGGADSVAMAHILLTLSGEMGFSVCAAIREVDAAVPVLFLSALGDEENQLKGFGYGADDYIEKTLPAPLFLARVEAALRRTRAAEPSGDFGFGEWRVKAAQRSMRRSTGETAQLSAREVAFMRLLVSRKREVLSRDWLLAKLCSGADVSDNLLSVIVHDLRGKLAAEGRAIRAVRGVGYSFDPTFSA